MDWFLYGNGLRHESVKFVYYQKRNLDTILKKRTRKATSKRMGNQ